VSGDIAEVNRETEENPDLIKEDPLGKGWLIKVTFSDEEELDDLMTADEYDCFKIINVFQSTVIEQHHLLN
ncbi:hypothetical protein ACFL6F_04370, partial [Planctomycetota bacterium]